MKKLIFVLSVLLLVIQCKSQDQTLDEILLLKYEQHFISSGDNFPEISLFKNDRYKFLIGLHNGFHENDIRKKLNWSDEESKSQIELLKNNGYLKEKDGSLFASISIIMNNEGQELFKQAEQVAEDIAQSIIMIDPEMKRKYLTLEVSEKHSYGDFKFFLLSDVLLDNWQINNVESDFLKKERTLRHGKRYFIQFAEKDSLMKKEVFGIYGNQYKCNDSICYITYGNNRKNHHRSLKELDSMNIPFLSKNDQNILDEMAEFYKPKLIKILEENRPRFTDLFDNSVFKDELPFEEFFIWYYHFIYTRATDILAMKLHIEIPKSGIFRVKLEQ